MEQITTNPHKFLREERVSINHGNIVYIVILNDRHNLYWDMPQPEAIKNRVFS
jgi:hypothetical protein